MNQAERIERSYQRKMRRKQQDKRAFELMEETIEEKRLKDAHKARQKFGTVSTEALKAYKRKMDIIAACFFLLFGFLLISFIYFFCACAREGELIFQVEATIAYIAVMVISLLLSAKTWHTMELCDLELEARKTNQPQD